VNELSKAVAILGRPYSVTRSRLGAITKVYNDKYVCDLNALKEIFTSMGEKLSQLAPTAPPQFSFLISFSDQTHFDGVTKDIEALATIPVGKQTQRVVMRWVIQHTLEGESNELSVTLRVSNPLNPLVYLQAALSKAPNEIDNMEFEMGATCVTVDGAGQAYADEIFLRIRNWLEARNRLHPYLEVAPVYRK
jgi:hypothetical protein